MTRKLTRRGLIQGLVVAGGVLLLPIRLFASTSSAFEADSADDVLRELFGATATEQSDAITLKVPAIAENGAVVPVTVSTDLEGVKSISLLIDGNPNPLSATFAISPDAFADISTRVKVGESSLIRAIVETTNGVFSTSKEIKVTIGGCGG